VIRAAALTIVLALCAHAYAQPAPAPAPSTTRAHEIRRGVEMGDDPQERGRRVFEQIIRKLEPDGVGHREHLPQYLELFKREFVKEPREFAVDLHADAGSDPLVVRGYLEFTEQQRALDELFHHLNLDVSNQTELLPAADLGDKPFAIVRADRAFIYDRSSPAPEQRSETLTECVAGDPLFLLKDSGSGRVLCHAPSGYVGWVDASAISRVDGSAFDKAINFRPPDPRIDTIIAAAREKLGTPYVWGGLTKQGIDCSGLVHSSFAKAGIILPRDADQQSLAGKLVATRWRRSSLRAGDLLFFLGRRGAIHHTAIYLADNQFIQATEPVVKISSFDRSDANYDDKRNESFCFAKRVIE